MSWLWVFVGGTAGAAARYLVDHAVKARADTPFPWGTLTVNVLGCAILGLLTGLSAHGGVTETVRLTLGVGLCGALTTYSTFSYETLTLAEAGERRAAVVNVLVSVVAGVGALLGAAALAGSW
ncbi:fluoride efflux transporter CrcB [Nocardiopsis lambiniae]|uniref:Fluoride-specific ion channel FluC n=1 Tax=Nocardiopsis lambiniae TaxID=3075539 RepID=A0ABU2M6R8_9ACTN|nr:fluoride efflux transporter CrcB [Nocardiopsis sp. DSM 44743]MDT0328368.1 fluoride efflux transporter CrcB [Nocardiopsis sp. DSM 44743]